MSGTDFDGTLIVESDEEPDRRGPEYHDIWDADDPTDMDEAPHDLSGDQLGETLAVQGDVISHDATNDGRRHIRPETWPNGSPMWATAPGSRIQLRMPRTRATFVSLLAGLIRPSLLSVLVFPRLHSSGRSGRTRLLCRQTPLVLSSS